MLLYRPRYRQEMLRGTWDYQNPEAALGLPPQEDPGCYLGQHQGDHVDYRETPIELRINEWVIPTYKKKWQRNEARWQTVQDREAREAVAVKSIEQSSKDLERRAQQEAHA